MFSTNLKYLRKKYNMEQLELAYKLGRKSGSTISEWEKGSYTPKIKVLAQIADIFHVDLDDLMNKDLTNSQTKVDKDSLVEQIAETSSLLHISRQARVYNYAREQLDEQLNEKSSIYVVGTSAAGEPIEYGDLDAELIDLSNIPAKADKAIHIKGDSMEPKIASNSIIFYHEQPTLEIGEIGIFEINGSAVTCKKYYVDYESKKIILKSINPKYEPMYFARDQVRILGKVVF
ncbi:MAG: helix-turn-helix domain-containing protein [Lactobacillus iners]|nr:helix-turn-helix domain-containing protein [Lactobacillus iners]